MSGPGGTRDPRGAAAPRVTPGFSRAAGEGISDEEMSREVAEQTSSDLKADDVFAREADGASSDVEAAKADPEDLPG